MSSGTAGPRTMSPGGQLVLGPHVRGESWSRGTAGPPTAHLELQYRRQNPSSVWEIKEAVSNQLVWLTSSISFIMESQHQAV